MISKNLKSNEQLIECVIKLGFVLADSAFPNMTLYSKENGNHYEIYFTAVDNIESVILKKFTPLEDPESKWKLESRHVGFENAIDVLNKEFKFELRKMKLKKLLYDEN